MWGNIKNVTDCKMRDLVIFYVQWSRNNNNVQLSLRHARWEFHSSGSTNMQPRKVALQIWDWLATGVRLNFIFLFYVTSLSTHVLLKNKLGIRSGGDGFNLVIISSTTMEFTAWSQYAGTCLCVKQACIVHTRFFPSTKHTYPALLLTAVRPFTPVFSKLLIRFSGIPHNPKPVQEHQKRKLCTIS